MNADEFFHKVHELPRGEVLDFIYSTIDDACCAGEFSFVDEVFEESDPQRDGVLFSIAILSITNHRHGFLKRETHAEKTKNYISKIAPERAEMLLRGLT